MKVVTTQLPEVLVLEPRVFEDGRGYFFESWNAEVFRSATGIDAGFVQDNESRSSKGVIRGIHYQVVRPQGKLVRVLSGVTLNVAVDLRRSSPRFGLWAARALSDSNRRQLWIPPGFGHGFAVTSESATVAYKMTEYWFKEHDRSVRWNDPTLAINWGAHPAPVLSGKDASAPLLCDAEVFD